MSVISVYDQVPGPRPPDHVPFIRARMEPQVTPQPTDFGWWLLQQMASRKPPLSQSDLARTINVSQSTISRWIYKDGRPDSAKLPRLAATLGVDPGDLLHRAGHGRPTAATNPRVTDPLRAKLDILLGEDSPIPPDKLRKLRAHLELVIEPWEHYLPGLRRAQ